MTQRTLDNLEASAEPNISVPEPWRTDWERLSGLLTSGHGMEARAYARALAKRWPDSKTIQHYARVLEPPASRRVPGSAPFRSVDQDYAWLQEHAQEYPGCWLAVFDSRLLAADPDLHRVVNAARRELGGEEALLYYQSAS